MRRILFLLIVGILCLLPFSLRSQDVQIKEVFDFSGGWVNSIANALMKDNMALDLYNDDIVADKDDKYMNLRRRQGMSLLWPDDGVGLESDALLPFHNVKQSDLLLKRDQGAEYDSSWLSVAALEYCDPTLESCTSTVWWPLYQPDVDLSLPYNQSWTVVNERLMFASTKGELVSWDGDSLFPARPFCPGQPRVMAIDSSGPLNGSYTYKYVGSHTDGAGDTSNASAPSFSARVHFGFVAVMLPPKEEGIIDTYTLYRKKGDSTRYRKLGDVNASANEVVFIDTFTTASGYMNYEWGEDDGGQLGEWPNNPLTPPGGLTTARYTTADTDSSIFDGCGVCDSIGEVWLVYSIKMIDSAGRSAYQTPASFYIEASSITDENVDIDFGVTLSNIPTPDDPKITKKLLLRRYNANFWEEDTIVPYPDTLQERWTILDTLESTVTTLVDTASFRNVGYGYCDVVESPYESALSPEVICYDDSAITFQPEAIAYHGNRLYAVGDLISRNTIHYSQFGRPTTFAPDKTLLLPSRAGDWFVELLSVSNNQLLLFRQNSIVSLTGLSFFQYQADEIMSGIGLTARRTLVSDRTRVYFGHRTGMYRLGSEEPLSLPIQATVDSVGEKIQRSVATAVDGELWWSVAVVGEANDRTLIYSERPTPHWRQYGFGFDDMVLYDVDTTEIDYPTGKYTLIRDNDSLYKWYTGGEYGSQADTLDDSALILASYQSKYFFEGGGREKILWVDLFAAGTVDTLWMIFYKNYGEGKVGTPFDTTIITPTFSDLKRDRIPVNEICENFSIRITDNGIGNYTIRGFQIGWIPWDRGKLE